MTIIDASVALKWVLEESGSKTARELLKGKQLAAPDLLFVECANVLWVKARRGQIAASDAKAAYAAIEAAPISVLPSKSHCAAAQTIAVELGQTVYDSLYLALALAERTELITADEEFAEAAADHPVYGRAIQLLRG